MKITGWKIGPWQQHWIGEKKITFLKVNIKLWSISAFTYSHLQAILQEHLNFGDQTLGDQILYLQNSDHNTKHSTHHAVYTP